MFDHARPKLDDKERLAWLRLVRTRTIGPRLFHELLSHYSTAQAALEALPELSRRGGRRIDVFEQRRAEAEIASAMSSGARFVAWGEADYPGILHTIDGAPPLVAIAGSGPVLARPAIAIVGARNCSLSASKFATIMAEELGLAGFTIVSGLARGIDAAAHKASLQTGTIAVLAGGLDRIYPPEHAELYARIIESDGAVISERPFGYTARGNDFPRRNRLVSGISYGVVVIEAAARSGTLHTARFALDQNREVFAAPGAPLDPRSEGCNRLIRDGAHLVTGSSQVTEVLAPIIGNRQVTAPASKDGPRVDPPGLTEPADKERDAVQSALGPAPVAIDEIIRHTGLDPRVVQFSLLELELAGRIERRSNQMISLVI